MEIIQNRFNYKRWEFRLGPIKNGDRSEDMKIIAFHYFTIL